MTLREMLDWLAEAVTSTDEHVAEMDFWFQEFFCKLTFSGSSSGKASCAHLPREVNWVDFTIGQAVLFGVLSWTLVTLIRHEWGWQRKGS